MYCRFCGNQLEDEAVFCGKCGNKVCTERDFSAPKQKQSVVAGILGVLLGSLGVHNFYLGHYVKAVIQLCFTLLSGGSLAAISAIWGLVEGVLLLCGVIKCDAKKNPLI